MRSTQKFRPFFQRGTVRTGHVTACLLLIGSVELLTLSGPAEGEEFRVQTRVFAGSPRSLVSSSTTMFRGSVAYDFADDDQEITLLDAGRGKFVLLDTKRQIKTRITTDEILEASAQLKKLALGQDDPLLTFCVQPKFEVTPGFDEEPWVFASKLLTYRVDARQSENPRISAQYRQFADWFARLNSVIRPQSLPPFARLAVNRKLAEGQQIPQQVELVLAAHRRFGNGETKMSSQHQFRTGLSGSEIDRIEQADRFLVTFRDVPLAEYLRTAQTARK